MGDLFRFVWRSLVGAFGRRLGYAAAAVVLGLGASRCHASGTVPSVQSQLPAWKIIACPSGSYGSCTNGSNTILRGSDRASLCSDVGNAWQLWANANFGTGTRTYTGSLNGSMQCVVTWVQGQQPTTYNFISDGTIGGPQTCPSNSTLSGSSCTCNSGYVPDGAGTSCVPQTACGSRAGQTFAAGYFNMGSEVQMHIAVACGADECEVVYDGATAQEKRIVNGVEQWFAQGLYRYTGQSCVGTTVSATPAPQAASAPPPTNTCASDQDGGTVNGVFKCFDKATGVPMASASTPSLGTTTTQNKVTNPDGSTTTTTTTVKQDSAGNQVTEKTVVTTNAAGTQTTTSTTTTGTGAVIGGGGGAGGGGSGGCSDNPSGAGCGGTAAATGQQRTPGTKTAAGVLGAFRDGLVSSQMGGAVHGFFTVASGGTCPTWTWHIPVIESEHVVDIFCSPWAAGMLAAIRAVLLIVCTWFAFRVTME